MIDVNVMRNELEKAREAADEATTKMIDEHSSYIAADLDPVCERLGYKPCEAQWKAAGVRYVGERHKQPFGDALQDILEKYELPVAKLAERLKRTESNVRMWIHGTALPRPTVQERALENIHNPLDK